MCQRLFVNLAAATKKLARYTQLACKRCKHMQCVTLVIPLPLLASVLKTDSPRLP